LRFYVDESALGLGKTLAMARKDTVHARHPLIRECPTSSLDTVWMPSVARRELIVVCRDKHIRSRPVERLAYRDNGLRVFFIGGKKDLSTWEWLGRLVKHWDRIEDLVSSQGPGPWGYVVTEAKLSPIALV